MKRIFAIIVMIFFIAPGYVPAKQPAPRLLVLGFSSSLLDEIEERFLREEVIRELSRRGISRVSVMQTERALRSRGNFNPFSAGINDIMETAATVGATHVITGRLACIDCGKKKVHKICGRYSYRCELKVFVTGQGKPAVLEVIQKGTGDRYSFLKALGRQVVTTLLKKSNPRFISAE